MSAATTTRCPYCEQQHPPRVLCDPARRVLDALIARGMAFNMPTLEFPDPIPADLDLGLGADDKLLQQIVIQAATVPQAGVLRPAVVLTGIDSDGHALPRWLYVGRDDDMAALVTLVTEMTDVAVRGAAAGKTVG